MNSLRVMRACVGNLLQKAGLKRLVLEATVYNPPVVYWKSLNLRRRYTSIQIGVILIPRDQFRHFVETVYAIDTTRSPKADNKYKHLLTDDLTVRLIVLEIANPHVFTKDIFTTMIWCREIKQIKDRIRARHRDAVPDYTYDTIIHSTDNDLQTADLLVYINDFARPPKGRSHL
jgi:hypothetical protein